MGVCIARIKLDSLLEFLLRPLPIPIEYEFRPTQRGVRLGQRTVKLEGLPCGCLGFRESLLGGQNCIRTSSQHRVGVSQPGVTQGVSRIFFDCLLEVFKALLECFRRPLVPIISPFEIKLVGLGVDRACACQARLLLGRHLDLDLAGNGSCDFILQAEDIAQITFIALGPQVLVRSCLDQLRRDAHPVA